MNIYAIPDPEEGNESFIPLHQTSTLKIEAIRSRLTHAGEEYNQEEDEWVVLIRGSAKMAIGDSEYIFRAGDSFFLERHTRHQVISTSDDALWIGVFSS